VLRDVSFVIPAGQVVAVVGHTGAGKTTLSHLLPRYYDPQQGAVTIGGHDVRDVPLAWVRGHIASVDQDVFLFHGTVGDNIRFGRPEAPDDDLRAAADALLSGSEAPVLQIPSIGCNIKWKPGNAPDYFG